MAAAICCFAFVTHHAGATSSTFSSLSTSAGSSPYSNGSAPGAEAIGDIEPSQRHSALPAVNEFSQCRRISPPKTFVCIVCGRPYNERDYQRHIEGFVKKSSKGNVRRVQDQKRELPRHYAYVSPDIEAVSRQSS